MGEIQENLVSQSLGEGLAKCRAWSPVSEAPRKSDKMRT